MDEKTFNQINAKKLTDMLGVNNTISTITTANLPTAKEYRDSTNYAFGFLSKWSEPKYKCPECDGGMCKNEMVVLTSYPAQYEYRCNKCGYVDYQYK